MFGTGAVLPGVTLYKVSVAKSCSRRTRASTRRWGPPASASSSWR
jgi:hypothetical protein